MALNVESVVGRGMRREKSLCGSHALETLRLALSSPSWLMRILGICARGQRWRLPQSGRQTAARWIDRRNLGARRAGSLAPRRGQGSTLALRITRRGLAAIGVAEDSVLLEAAESSGAGQGADPACDKPARRTAAARRKKTTNESPRLAAKPSRSDSKVGPCARDAPTQTWRDHRDGPARRKVDCRFRWPL